MTTVDQRQQLEQLLSRRILLLDGAMGTMIQRHRLAEADFRSERFRHHPRDLQGDIDLLLIETIFDTLNAKAAIVAVQQVFDEMGVKLPLMVSVTITDRSGRTLSGQTVEAFWVSVAHAEPLIVGVNCALGASEMRPYLAELAHIGPTYISCHPNAGLPNAFGEYDEQPETTASLLRAFAIDGLVNVIGGCCGTTPEHIRAIGQAVDGLKPRQLLTANT